ncbi:NAD(+) diphosphatase [soil metagenome]
MQPPHIRLHAGAHDRLGLQRRDDEWLDRSFRKGRILVVAGTRVSRELAWVDADQAPAGVRVLLGERDDVAHWAVITSERVEGWVALRDLLADLAGDPSQAPLIFHALGIAEWLRATRFCARCGTPVTPAAAGHELVCANGHSTFPRTDPAVIMLVTTDGGERALLGRHARWGDQPRYSTLAGFCEPGESLEDAVRREVDEEAGIALGEVAYFGNQPWPLPASLMLGFTAQALGETIDLRDGELADARWFTREELRSAMEHGTVIVPEPVSISRSLIDSWLTSPSG